MRYLLLASYTITACLLIPAVSLANESPNKITRNKLTDLRVIVDISGSMKKTDPKNLRRPAVRLLAGLIPENSRSGIWNFGQQVNMAVKIGKVDENWREKARQESEKISSIGLYTNIEAAMRKAMFDWNQADTRYNRNLILLTDGHVDISKDDSVDKQSREKIINDILPRLEKAGVKVHTIALSDDVDEMLLSTLSAYTDGLFKKVNSADDLQKLFLQMLQQSVRLDTLPLKNNRFNVDSSVNDMTLLVFNADENNPTKIISPAKKTWDINKAKTSKEKVKWVKDKGFDLVTIKSPQPGEWKIIAPLDDNNRVVVATNLKLVAETLPGYLMIGDEPEINAKLLEDNLPLADKRLLAKFRFQAVVKPEAGAERKYELVNSKKNPDNYFLKLPPVFKAGNYELVIQAKSPTVQREVRHQFQVYSNPAEIKIEKHNGKYHLKITPHGNLLRPGSIQIDTVMNDQSKYELKRDGDDWVLELGDQYGQTMFDLNINAKRADGKEISVSYNRVLKEDGSASQLSLLDDKKTKSAKEKQDQAEEQKLSGSADKDLKESKKETKQSTDEELGINWTIVVVAIVAGNIILGIIFGAGCFYVRRRREKLKSLLKDEVSDELDEKPETEPDTETKAGKQESEPEPEPVPVTFEVPDESGLKQEETTDDLDLKIDDVSEETEKNNEKTDKDVKDKEEKKE